MSYCDLLDTRDGKICKHYKDRQCITKKCICVYASIENPRFMEALCQSDKKIKHTKGLFINRTEYAILHFKYVLEFSNYSIAKVLNRHLLTINSMVSQCNAKMLKCMDKEVFDLLKKDKVKLQTFLNIVRAVPKASFSFYLSEEDVMMFKEGHYGTELSEIERRFKIANMRVREETKMDYDSTHIIRKEDR